jgi:hypothetical protein
MNEQNNTLKAWATGKLAMFAIGLAVGYFIYKSGLIQKLTGKLLSSKSSESSE